MGGVPAELVFHLLSSSGFEDHLEHLMLICRRSIFGPKSPPLNSTQSHSSIRNISHREFFAFSFC